MGHGVQNRLPEVPEKRPAGHFAHASVSLTCPAATPKEPGWQDPGHTGKLLPTPGLYVPLGHCLHHVALGAPSSALVVPGGQ